MSVQKPLGEVMLHAVMRLLFAPNFTIATPPYRLWQNHLVRMSVTVCVAVAFHMLRVLHWRSAKCSGSRRHLGSRTLVRRLHPSLCGAGGHMGCTRARAARAAGTTTSDAVAGAAPGESAEAKSGGPADAASDASVAARVHDAFPPPPVGSLAHTHSLRGEPVVHPSLLWCAATRRHAVCVCLLCLFLCMHACMRACLLCVYVSVCLCVRLCVCLCVRALGNNTGLSSIRAGGIGYSHFTVGQPFFSPFDSNR